MTSNDNRTLGNVPQVQSHVWKEDVTEIVMKHSQCKLKSHCFQPGEAPLQIGLKCTALYENITVHNLKFRTLLILSSLMKNERRINLLLHLSPSLL